MVTSHTHDSVVPRNTNPRLVSARGSCPASPRADGMPSLGAGSLVSAAFYADFQVGATHPSPIRTV